MPSKVTDLQDFSSSSYFSKDLGFPNERQVGFWKANSRPYHYAGEKSVASSSFENHIPAEFQSLTSLGHQQPFLLQDQKMNGNLNRLAVGAERESSHSLPSLKPIGHNSGLRSNVKAESTSYFTGGQVNMMGSHNESSLFTSSFSDLFSRKLRLSNNALYGHSADTVASYCEEEDVLEPTEEVEAHTIGNLLPDDDDLLSGIVDGFGYNTLSSGGDCMEELDLFSSVGGMDLEDNVSSDGQKGYGLSEGLSKGQAGDCNGSTIEEHPHCEHPSRTLFVRNINSNVDDSELKTLFEQYGDIRTLYTTCKHRGFVMISYYDFRAARNAMKALQNRPLRRRKLDIHYSIPKDNPSEKDVNQGTLVVFNLDSSVSNDELRQIFGAYGEIKEIRETSHRSLHKFIEFYDVRAAEAALRALNGSDIAGKQIKLEPSRPVGVRRSLGQLFPLEQNECGLYLQQSNPPMNSATGFSVSHGAITSSGIDSGTIMGAHNIQTPTLKTAFHPEITSSVPNSLPSLLRGESVGNKSGLTESNNLPGPQKLEIHGTPAFHLHSLPEYHDGKSNSVHHNSLGTGAGNINSRPSEGIDNRQFGRVNLNGNSVEFNEGGFGSAGNSSCPLPGHHYNTWNNSYNPQPLSVMWPNSPSFVNGICAADSSRLHGLPRAPSHILNTALPMTNHHVGSAPAVNPSLWDRRPAYGRESPEVSGFHPGSLGSMRISNSPQSMAFVSQNIYPHLGGNSMNLSVSSKTGLQSHHQRCALFPGRGQMISVKNSFDPPNERPRSRRNEGNTKADKRQYELDIDSIMRGDDKRTTLMIKNIPNKYTSKMLLAAIDERHRGTYDFIYLPIDFKNKCNVGYAFINMIDPKPIIPFYQTFNGKKWEKFNSEKVASLAYARIQGKAALIAHFQNSSLMNEDKRCRPILFNTEGPNAGDQVPFPMGVNICVRPGKASGTNNRDENHNGSPPNMENGETSSEGETSSGSM